MKHKKLNMFILLGITIFMIWYILKDYYNEIIDALLNANYIWIFVAIFFYFLHLVFEVMTFWSLTKMYSNNTNFKFQLYLGLINKFFAGITPFSTGGQPMQVYELHKKGLTVTQATNISGQAYMVYQIALMLTALVALILNKTMHLFAYVPFLAQLTLIGFIINLIILIVLALITFSKNFNRKILKVIIKILSKIRIVKNKEASLEKWNKICDNYYENGQVLLHNKDVFVKCVFYEILSFSFYNIIPFILAFALGIKDISIIISMSASSYIFISGCFVPIPGASGGMEYAFGGFFGNFVTGYALNAYLVLWRFVTYYLSILVGAIVFNVHKGRNRKAN